jgi:hypothetical protein
MNRLTLSARLISSRIKLIAHGLIFIKFITSEVVNGNTLHYFQSRMHFRHEDRKREIKMCSVHRYSKDVSHASTRAVTSACCFLGNHGSKRISLLLDKRTSDIRGNNDSQGHCCDVILHPHCTNVFQQWHPFSLLIPGYAGCLVPRRSATGRHGRAQTVMLARPAG